jgi:hypothetical protein
MKQANIGVFVVLALASTSLVASPQAKDVKGPAIGKTQKSPRLRQVGNYPTMLNMTFPEFAAATAKTDILLLSIGSIEEPASGQIPAPAVPYAGCKKNNALRGFCFLGSSLTPFGLPPRMQPASPWEQRPLAWGCPRKWSRKRRHFYVLHIC